MCSLNDFSLRHDLWYYWSGRWRGCNRNIDFACKTCWSQVNYPTAKLSPFSQKTQEKERIVFAIEVSTDVPMRLIVNTREYDYASSKATFHLNGMEMSNGPPLGNRMVCTRNSIVMDLFSCAELSWAVQSNELQKKYVTHFSLFRQNVSLFQVAMANLCNFQSFSVNAHYENVKKTN